MAYTAWSVVYGEQPTAAKWNQLGTNDAGFKDGTNIDNLAILERHLNDGAVTLPKLGFGVEQTLVTNQLASANASMSASFTAKKLLTVEIFIICSSTGSSPYIRFNGDSSNNYVYRSSTNGAADVQSTAQSNIPAIVFNGAISHSVDMKIKNFAGSEKHIHQHNETQYSNGAANIQDRREISARYTSSTQISSIEVFAGTSTLAAGSYIKVSGSD